MLSDILNIVIYYIFSKNFERRTSMQYLLQAILYAIEILVLIVWKPLLVILIFYIGICFISKSIKNYKEEKKEGKE